MGGAGGAPAAEDTNAIIENYYFAIAMLVFGASAFVIVPNVAPRLVTGTVNAWATGAAIAVALKRLIDILEGARNLKQACFSGIAIMVMLVALYNIPNAVDVFKHKTYHKVLRRRPSPRRPDAKEREREDAKEDDDDAMENVEEVHEPHNLNLVCDGLVAYSWFFLILGLSTLQNSDILVRLLPQPH
jgi:hypothetical protein